MSKELDVSTVYRGRHLSMARRGHWEFATRNTNKPAVGIVAVTDAGKVVLVEQYRPPVGQPGYRNPRRVGGRRGGIGG